MKVALHAHSDWSYDGHWSLDRIARVFGACGIDAVMMSEHDTGFDPARFPEYRQACAEASTTRCQLIPGIEYSSPDNDIHMLCWGLSDFLAEHQPVLQTLAAVQERGGVTVFAHPIRRRAFAQFDPSWVPYLSGIELWNRKSDGLTWGWEAAALIAQTGLPATVGMDFHKARHFYPLINRFAVSDSTRLETDLVAAIGAGQQQIRALGRPVLGADGRPVSAPHERLEKMRKGGLGILRRRR